MPSTKLNEYTIQYDQSGRHKVARVWANSSKEASRKLEVGADPAIVNIKSVGENLPDERKPLIYDKTIR